jgi:hypothetical protein
VRLLDTCRIVLEPWFEMRSFVHVRSIVVGSSKKEINVRQKKMQGGCPLKLSTLV